MEKVIAIIPSRLQSARLARKPLRLISGHPMIVWVYHRTRLAPCVDEVVVATDSTEIESLCRQANMRVMMTSPEHRSGTDRLVEVAHRLEGSPGSDNIYINVQGDEPMITPGHLELLLAPLRRDPAAQVSTLKVRMAANEALNPNAVKVVTDIAGRALYFSRLPIPFDRDATGVAAYFKHLGFYAYRAATLRRFPALPVSMLEQSEKLEQLRFLENGVPIHVAETSDDTIGVDTPEDLKRVEHIFQTSSTTLPDNL
jgi:3-deoxy-manno-octulosonate cytidylyltransferase (CMP-KDO synthetase)